MPDDGGVSLVDVVATLRAHGVDMASQSFNGDVHTTMMKGQIVEVQVFPHTLIVTW